MVERPWALALETTVYIYHAYHHYVYASCHKIVLHLVIILSQHHASCMLLLKGCSIFSFIYTSPLFCVSSPHHFAHLMTLSTAFGRQQKKKKKLPNSFAPPPLFLSPYSILFFPIPLFSFKSLLFIIIFFCHISQNLARCIPCAWHKKLYTYHGHCTMPPLLSPNYTLH